MLGGALRRAVGPTTFAALGIGCIAAVVSRQSSSADASQTSPPTHADLTMAASSAAAKVTTRLSDIAGATLTRLPTPSNGTAAATVKASSLWAERPAVVLVLRRPG